ncbi:hypothetical protein [Streptosporangium fragile]|uniref:hypothetical protein n=1 Tax=Streptosporangium fragile TaxID=46186 RepID=UPI0031E5A9CB
MVATFVLLVNDHLLKALQPGPVTGKLSDIAGLLVAPPLLALALSLAFAFSPALVRLAAPAATVATGIGFALVKTTEAGAGLASQAWTLVAGPSRVLADPTDLVALPALGAAWLVWRRSRADHAVRRARVLIIVPVALISVTATSQAPAPPAAVAVTADDDAITVFSTSGFSRGAAFSRDGGRTWSPAPAPAALPSPATRACLPDDPRHCYRVVPPRLAVDESLDGGANWKTVWTVSEGRADALRRNTEDHSARAWQGSAAVAVQRRPDGHVVVVANGNDGIAVRDTRGTWQRLGFPPSGEGFSADAAVPLRSPDVSLVPEYRNGFFAGLLGFMAGMAVARRHEPRTSRLAVSAYILAPAGFVLSLPSDSVLGTLMLVAGVACALIAAALTTAAAIKARVPGRAWAALLAIAVCTPLVIGAVFTSWVSGTPDDYATAGLLAWLAGGTGVGASVLVGWTATRNAAGRPAA